MKLLGAGIRTREGGAELQHLIVVGAQERVPTKNLEIWIFNLIFKNILM